MIFYRTILIFGEFGEKMMEFVSTKDDLRENAKTLDSYLKSNDSAKQRFAKSLVSRGKCFVVVQGENGLQFYPSRFMGYKNNSQEKHEEGREKRIVDGRETNPVIDGILQCRSLPSNEFEAEYMKFCKSLGIKKKTAEQTEKRPRFWEEKL